jgi:uncharacterized protein YkwD
MRHLALLVCFIVISTSTLASSQENPVLSSSEIREIKLRILDLINQQRRSMGLREVEYDEFAAQVGERHCREMLKDDYISHWNRAGIKPYTRYSDSGGNDAVSENLSAFHGTVHFNPEFISRMVEDLHMRMFNERPPNDQHRQNILQPQHTHVGIGIAYSAIGLRLAQEFVARYVKIQPVPRTAKTGEKITVKGELLFDKTDLHNVYIFYEPTPKPLSVDELLRRVIPYGLSDDETVMRPILSSGYKYTDGTTGEINYDASSGKFSFPILFPKNKPGLYTIVTVIKHEKNKFAATNISVRVE